MVEVVREIYLWFYYMIKRVGVAFGFYASFFLIQYIIRAACNTFYQFFFGRIPLKGFKIAIILSVQFRGAKLDF